MILGICCIINELREKDIFTSRSLIRRTFTMEKASQLALQNSKDLLELLKYCKYHNIHSFRVGSDFFPRMTDINYQLQDLSTYNDIVKALAEAGKFANSNNILLSCHPGPFTILSSPKSNVNASGIKEVEMHSLIGDLLCTDADLDFTINFHINTKYDSMQDTANRFISNFNLLSHNAKKRVILENDDKKAGWTVNDLYNNIYKHTNIPITFDIHHWNIHNDGTSMEQDFKTALSTWNSSRSPQVHYSQSPTDDKLIPAHSDYYRNKMPQFISDNQDIHVHLEAKAKEQALFKYLQL